MEHRPIEPSSISRLCVIVAGMHRSGTSAVTRVVNLLGADIARELMPTVAGDNDRGFWESASVFAIHEQLLRALGSSWDDPFPLPDRWIETSAAREAKRRLAEEIARDFGDSRLFVTKDPRITRLLPLWLDLLDELSIRPIVVIPVRNPLEVAASLEERNLFTRSKSLLMYVRSYLETELASRERQRLFVRYDDLLADWREFAARLGSGLGARLPPPSADRITEIGEFLSKDLYRNRFSREQVVSQHGIATMVVELFDRMTEAADGGDETALRPAFDRLRDTLEEATKLFQGLILGEPGALPRARKRGAIERLKAELEAARAQAAKTDAELAVTRQQADERERELAAQSKELAAQSRELASARQRAAELQEAVEVWSAQAARLDAELATALPRAAQAEGAAEALRRELDAIEQSVSWRLTAPLRQALALIRLIETMRFVPEIRHRLGLRRDHKLIAASGLFDDGWYRARFPDVNRRGTDSLVHYLQHGAAEGRDPNPLFDSDWYLQRYPDVAARGSNPLAHYLRHGAQEGRDPNPLFDSDWYLERYPDVAAAGTNPLLHYLRHGAREGRDPSPLFSTEWYLSQYPDVAEVQINPLAHYLRHGAAEGRDLHAIDTNREFSVLYQDWIRRFDELKPDDLAQIRRCIASEDLPLIAMLVIFDDVGRVEAFSKRLANQLHAPSKVVYCFTENCSPAAVSRIAAELQDDARCTILRPGSDESICLPDDCRLLAVSDGANVLREHALFMLAGALRERNSCMAYSDEDRIGPTGERTDPYFKPDFSPELAARTDYLGTLAAFAIESNDITAIVRQTLRDRTASAAIAQAAAQRDARRVLHIPFVLYGAPGRGEIPNKPSGARPDTRPLGSVSIIIPTRDRLDLLRPCIAGIRQKSSYPTERVEIIVVDNGSRDRATLRYLMSISESGEAVVLRDPGDFNYSRLNNLGAARASGDILIFLNNDTVVDQPDWLAILASYASQEDIGAVGAKLLYPDRKVQHGGVIVGVQGVAAHAHVGLSEFAPGYHGLACIDHEVTAVTGACLAIRKAVFEQIGGFDTNLKVAFGDTALCLQAVKEGYRNMYVGQALLVHFESKSRGLDDTPEKRALFRAEANYARSLHDDLFRNDPSYNPNLSLETAYRLAFPPRRRKPWRTSSYGDRNIRALVLSVTHEIGHGVPVVVDLMSRYLSNHNFDVFVGGPRGRHEFSYDGCKRVYLHDAREAALFAVENDIDCVIAHTPPFFSVARWTGDWPRMIVYDHGEPNPEFFPDEAARREVLAEKRFVSTMAHRLFAISVAVQAASGIDRMQVIRSANSHLATWDDTAAQRRARARAVRGWSDKTIILNVCRFHEAERRYKGVDLYVSIMSQFIKARSDLASRTLFVICGKASDDDVAFARGCGLQVEANVTDDEMIDLYVSADIYMNMSRWEGYNLGIAQALALGLPVIASDIPAHREFNVTFSNDAQFIVEKLAKLVRAAQSGELQASRQAQVESWERPLSRFVEEISILCKE